MPTVYQSCVKMLSQIPDGETLTLDSLTALIMRHIGGQPHTIRQALLVMGSTGLIKDIGECKFKVKNERTK